ncbi:hypothetical protein MCOR02_006078 [Pyricularia oryzae]|uniref:Cutinase n=4 Tax=Pyricularia oryzae TaxID=318829 RepID=G4NEV7_PYRO7|nr:cutinase 1 [Pyricularia oryzae 70-15]ELQ36081.1 cutinase 1 [Pyricularia oryzae Y34]KAH9434049.1 hypothetical protein MCOR02_006078 [Pyricularia oryzae]EHA48683.1 cutinase 1 [Pyricularia oryzae 70-15]KAI6496768.1 hypothetical protein MCOR13_006886 [Pyricularia oryzae]KAI6562817.1 hypothetical protein MCOR04_009278 [Pyricularia oryzae]
MKATTALTFLVATLASASPTGILEDRQLLGGRVGAVAKEFTMGGCKPIIMIFARGSTEIGNMGAICGPPTANGVKAKFGAGNVAVEGVDYAAGLATNFLRGGADPVGITEMKRLIAKANAECPDSMLVVGGYSQGAALTHRAVENLPQAQKNQIKAAFTFGDTQKQQDRNQIKGFPREKTNIICQPGDLVCVGTLTITPAHLSYGVRANEQVAFITKALMAAGAGAAR